MAKPTKTKAAIDAADLDKKAVCVVNSGKPGYRRAGVAHKEGRVVHPPGTFTADQVEQLNADPRLAVVLFDPAEASAEG